MFRIIVLFFLGVISFSVFAEVDFTPYDALQAKLECIEKHGGVYSKHASVCFEKTPTVIESVNLTPKKKLAKVKRDSEGRFHWKKVGGAPVKTVLKKMAKQAQPETFIGKKLHDDLIAMELTSRDMEKVFHPIFDESLDMLGLLKGEAKEKHEKEWRQMLSDGSRYIDIIQKGDELEYLSFDKKVVNSVIVDFDTPQLAYVFPLEDGRELVWVRDCWNFAIRKAKKIPQLPGEPVTKEPEPPGKPPVIEQLPQENILDDWELFISMGGSIGEGHSAVGYGALSGAYFPAELMVEMENGRLGFGPSFQANGWIGKTFNDFKYNGFVAVGGLAAKYIDWDGWDFEARVQAGWIEENGHMDAYDSKRSGVVIGPTASYNNYQRQLAGKDWFPEWGLYGSILFPLDFDAEHSWQGVSIADTSDLRRFGFLANVSYRQIIYKNDDWGVRFYGQIGYFNEDPVSQSLSARLGIGDTKKRWGLGVGPNFDLMNNWNTELGLDVWADISAIVDQSRVESNMEEMRKAFEANGIHFDDETGMLDIPEKSSRKTAPIPTEQLDGGMLNIPAE